jgi:predicted ATPase
MLKRVQIENFRAFRSVDVPLSPFTVVIGKNDTGKSSFLDAIRKLSIGQQLTEESDRHRFDQDVSVIIRGIGRDDQILTVGNKVGPHDDALIRPATLFRLPVHGVSMESPGYDDKLGPQPLGEDGKGVPGFLDYCLRRDRERFAAIVSAVRSHVPGVLDIGIPTPDANTRRLELVLRDRFRIQADQSSAGVRLMLFFIALFYHPSPPKIVMLDEPENGIHPKRLADVVKLLKTIAHHSDEGRNAQVIISTHSPYLLDCVDLREDQVLIFRRGDDGACTVEPADRERLCRFIDEFMLGEIWYNQGEEGMIKNEAALVRP